MTTGGFSSRAGLGTYKIHTMNPFQDVMSWAYVLFQYSKPTLLSVNKMVGNGTYMDVQLFFL